MEKNITLQKIHNLNELYLKTLSEEVLLDMESILINYLHCYPKDTDMWLKLLMVEFTCPLEDYDRIEEYANAVIAYDKNNIQNLLILAYAQYIFRGGIKKDLFILLRKVCDISTNQKLLSMVYLAMAWYYRAIDEKEYERSLLKSINCCDKYVSNYICLGRLYFDRGNIAEGKKMIQLGLKNVQKMYEKGDLTDVTDLDKFFDEYFKGTYITQENLRSIQNLIK